MKKLHVPYATFRRCIIDNDHVREQLRQLNSDELADALMKLAQVDATAQDTVLRMTTAKSESLARYKAKLKKLASTNRFISWQGVQAYCEELEQMLLDLQAGVEDA